MSNLSKQLQSLKALSQVELERQRAIDRARQLLSSVTSAVPLGAEWDPFWDAVIFVTEDENVFMVSLNDGGIGMLVRCQACQSLFWLRPTTTNLFYVSRGYIPPNTHQCGKYIPGVPPHMAVVKQVGVPELRS